MIPCLLATSILFGQAPVVWPTVSGATVWISRGHATNAPRTGAAPTVQGDVTSVNLKKPDTNARVAIEFLAVVREDGAVFSYGGQKISFTAGKLELADGPFVPMPGAKLGVPLDVVFVTRFNDVAIYANGEFYTSFAPTTATKISFVAKTPLQGLVTFDHALSPMQVKRDAVAGHDFVQGFHTETAPAEGAPTDGKHTVLELQLKAFTPVPDPSRIKPYRNALLAQEYQVISVVQPGPTSLKAGDLVRVFRYGVWDGKQTKIKDQKSGDRVRLKIEPLSADPVLEREYQLDTLDTSYGPYYVEAPADATSAERS